MSPSRRVALYAAVAAILLGAIVFGSYQRYAGQRQRALGAVAEHRACEALAEQIRALQTRPQTAGQQEMDAAELVRRIQTAAEQAQVPTDQLARIWPEPARRLRDSAYLQKPTQVLVRQVNFQQIMTFLHHLSQPPAPLHVQRLRLSVAPDASAAGSSMTGRVTGGSSNRWSADATLSYLIYAPREEAEARNVQVNRRTSP